MAAAPLLGGAGLAAGGVGLVAAVSGPDFSGPAVSGPGASTPAPAGRVAGASSPAAATALAFAQSQLGVPYRWGGEAPGQAFDCSGLVQWAYAQAGITLPRIAQAQFDAGPPVPAGAPMRPGDLVFFGPGPTAVEHVGMYAGAGLMIDAPHTGADVRIESVPTPFVGVTRPASTV